MAKTTAPNPSLVAKSGVTYTIYTLPRCFKENALLHPFLASKTPKEIQLNNRNYTLYQVLFALRQVISKEKMFDPNNTTVIICSPELEQAIDRKSLHVTEVRDLVILQMDVTRTELLASLAPPQPQRPIAGAGSGQPFDTEGHYWLKPLFLKVLRSVKDKVNESGTLVKGVPPNKVVFSYREVTSYLSQYILEHQNKFFDGRNIKVAHVDGDPLGQAFGVKVFHRTQVTALLRKQLIPFKPQQQGKLQNNAGPDQSSAQISVSNRQSSVPAYLAAPASQKILRFATDHNDLKIEPHELKIGQTTDTALAVETSATSENSSSRKRSHEVENNSGAKDENNEIPIRRVRRRSSTRSSISITFVKDNRESDDETIYSAQGYDTNAVEDQDISDDDNDFDVYDVEYEPEGLSSDEELPAKLKKEEENLETDESELDEDVVIVAATAFELLSANQSYDDEADESSDDDTNVFDGVDLENTDTWKCLNCKQPNTPYMRYCSACYKERKGWLPERPKPKKRKHKQSGDSPAKSKCKRTNGISLKSTQQILERSATSVTQSSNSQVNIQLKGQLPDSQDSGYSGEIESNSIESELSSDEEKEGKGISQIEKTFLEKGMTISSSSPSMLCSLCCSQPKNACLVHGRISHQVCCYGCARKLFKNKRPCPVCRRRVEKITKNIIA